MSRSPLTEPVGRREDVPERNVGCGLREHAGCVSGDDAPFGAGWNVDVVIADSDDQLRAALRRRASLRSSPVWPLQVLMH